MSTTVGITSNKTSANTSQVELRQLMNQTPAAERFYKLFGQQLDPFVGKIKEVFQAPKAEGAEFEFAPDQRQPFLNLVDPSTSVGNMNYSNFPSGKRGAMVPDDPGPGSPDRVWRRLASLVSAGISYREPGLKASLHIAIRRDSADVHLDREGFVHSLDGRISYNPRMVINHLSADLLSDHVPLLVSSLRIKDKNGKNTFEGNFAPWLEVNLPGSTDISGQRRESTGVSIGFRLFGIFEAGGG